MVDDKPQYICIEDSLILFAQPRRLVIQVYSLGLKCIATVLHAYDSGGDTDVQILGCWKTTTELFEPLVCSTDHLMCGIDAKPRAKEPLPGVVGDILDRGQNTERRSTDQEWLPDFCCAYGRYVANTFSELVMPGSATGKPCAMRLHLSVRRDQHGTGILPSRRKLHHM